MLRAENVTVRYGAQTVVNGLSFELRAGQWLMLVGPNGAGKSTLIEAIAQGVPYTGRILLEGRDIRALKGAERARSVGFLAQKNAVSYAYSVEEVVSLGRYAHASGFLSARDDEGEACVERALEWTGLTALRRASVLTLSGGELQRTFLAQVFAQNPKLLILDEPANHLDLIYQKHIFSLIEAWLKQPGRAVISVVHDLSLAKKYGTHAVLMDRGRCAAQGKTAEVMTRERLEAVYGMDVYGWMRDLLGQWAYKTNKNRRGHAMKFLHLSDLHLGKQMNDVSLLADQEAVLLGQVVPIARRENVDAVLIAGDVYQRATPQAEAVALFDRFVSELAAMGRRVFIISGNHDSAQRISYFSALVRSAGVYVTEAFEGRMQSVTLSDEYGELTVWMLPFLRPQQVKRFLPEEKIVTYQDAMQAVLRQTPIDGKKRNILLCHQFITGAVKSDSEEHTVGGLDQIDAAVFDAFDYVALGHIHRPQRVRRETLRYAGSPLKYSFSEADYGKSVPVVDVREKGCIDVHIVPLSPMRDVRRVEGMMDELMRMPYSEDYVWVTVHDECVPPDARVTLSGVFPNIMKFSIVNSKTKTDLDVTAAQRMESKSVVELFADFYRLQNNDQPPSAAHMKEIEKTLRELEERP